MAVSAATKANKNTVYSKIFISLMKQGPSIKNIFKLIVVISYDTTILNKLYLIIKNPQVPKKVMYRIIIKKYFTHVRCRSFWT